MPGPVPKRSEQRIRRNKPDVPIDHIQAGGVVRQPKLGLVDPHPIIVDLWDSLADSAESQFYEPSDWQFARFVLHFADVLLKQAKPSAQLFQGVNSALGDLLVSEGSRRRLRLEVERGGDSVPTVEASKIIFERLRGEAA